MFNFCHCLYYPAIPKKDLQIHAEFLLPPPPPLFSGFVFCLAYDFNFSLIDALALVLSKCDSALLVGTLNAVFTSFSEFLLQTTRHHYKGLAHSGISMWLQWHWKLPIRRKSAKSQRFLSVLLRQRLQQMQSPAAGTGTAQVTVPGWRQREWWEKRRLKWLTKKGKVK